MPGGKNYRQWYAARKSMQERGKWVHNVPAQEEGEPPAQRARKWWEIPTNEYLLTAPAESPAAADAGSGAEADLSSGERDSLPELEASPTPEGRPWLILASLCLLGLRRIPTCSKPALLRRLEFE